MSDDYTVDVEIDTRGLNCPLPILKAKRALTGMQSGQVLKVVATDAGSIRDFQAFAKQTGNTLLDQQTLALVHGDFAALVFSLMAILILITSRGWEQRSRMTSTSASQRVTTAAKVLLLSLIAQYVMGGFLRHLRERSEFAWAWMVHPWFAIVVLCTSVVFVWAVQGTNSVYLSRCATAIVGLAVTQSLIGLATWYVKYGVPSWGVVAQQDSLPQIIVCSLHKVVGLLTLMTSVLTVVCCWAVKPLQDHERSTVTVQETVVGAAT